MDLACVGLLSIIIIEGRNLKSMELIGKQDPYCKFEHSEMVKRGKTIQKGTEITLTRCYTFIIIYM